MKVLVAPDSFKGSATASEAADAIAEGWRSERPDDEVVLLPQADGGEGTLEALSIAIPGARFHSIGAIPAPHSGTLEGIWLELPDGTAVVELAALCGLPLHEPLDPLHASTFALGQVLAAVTMRGAPSIVVALGGSASTDGGAGALKALGLRLLDAEGRELGRGGNGLRTLATINRTALTPPPPGGVQLLTDVTNPLLGSRGAAAVYAPQKGASPADIVLLEQGLERFAAVAGGNPEQSGSGAAGGTAYGLATLWGALISDGAATVARLTGLTTAVVDADVLITGEGQLDQTSLHGKVVGHALDLAAPLTLERIVIAGRVHADAPGASILSLTDLAGSADAAMQAPLEHLRVAGAAAARATPPSEHTR